MKSIVIIPSRLGSTRLPNKPLINICGIPMIGHCYLRAKIAKSFLGAYVATCDKEIYSYIDGLGGSVVMTSNEHTRATTRTAEALLEIEKVVGPIDVVIMVQGDEPLIKPTLLEKLLSIFENDVIDIANVMTRFNCQSDYLDLNNIKVVVDKGGDAIYFSRQPIPLNSRSFDSKKCLMQTGIIAFRREALIRFNSLPESFLEISESIDMNRVLENQGKVRMVLAEDKLIGVDVEADISKVETLMMQDDLFLDYGHKFYKGYK